MDPVALEDVAAEAMGNIKSSLSLAFMRLILLSFIVSLPGDNPFYSNIDSMPDIRPRRKSIPLVSELVRNTFSFISLEKEKLAA